VVLLGLMNPHGLMYFCQAFLSSVLALLHVVDPWYSKIKASCYGVKRCPFQMNRQKLTC